MYQLLNLVVEQFPSSSTVYLGSIYLMVLWRGASDYMQDWADRRSVVLVRLKILKEIQT